VTLNNLILRNFNMHMAVLIAISQHTTLNLKCLASSAPKNKTGASKCRNGLGDPDYTRLGTVSHQEANTSVFNSYGLILLTFILIIVSIP